MAEKTTYELKGTLRDECTTSRATLDGFRPLESDWRELMRWLMSVSGDVPYYDSDGRENGRLSSLWENHVLTVLVDIICKDIGGYVDSFVEGRGTSARRSCFCRLQDSFRNWISRLETFVRTSRNMAADSPSVAVASLMAEQLEDALSQDGETRMEYASRRMDDTNRPYYRMLGAVEDIQKKGSEYIARIESGADLDASLALLLTFVRNYCGIASRFNRRFGSWADFYRKNILLDTPKGAVQDSTYVIIEPDRTRKAETFPLPEGTKFVAGYNADGSRLVYATAEKAYIVPAHINSVHSLFVEDNRPHTAELPTEGRDNVFPLFDAVNPSAAPLEYGWLLTSRSLVLSEGRRTVTIDISLERNGRDSTSGISYFNGNTSAFILQLSGSEGWRQKEKYGMETDREQGLVRFTFTLDEGEKAPSACTEELHGIVTGYPALRILFAESNITGREVVGELYIKKITIHTEVEGIRGFTLMGESGQADPSQPFYPFGPTGERGSRLTFGHEEAAQKNITSVTLKGTWTKLPVKGFKPIYENYGLDKAIDDSSFTVCCEWQEGSRWHECAASSQRLFRMDGTGKLADEAVFEIALDGKTATDGFYRLTLDSPETGFGTNVYYRRFTEVIMHNGREKEKNRLPLPEQPQVPMLGDMTMGYESEETLDPEAGGCLYRFSELLGYEACTSTENSHPAFYPCMETAAILLNLSHMGDTDRVRLYLALHYAADGWKPAVNPPACKLIISRYSGNGIWQEIPDENMLCEETDGMTRSGFVEFKTSAAEGADNLWLKLSFAEDKVPESMVLEGICLNCLRVTAENGDGSPLPAGTITAPQEEDSRIHSVCQPFVGSGGKPVETEQDAIIRQRIRISTRNRAVCSSNYEEMILERFPEIEKACCIPASINDGAVRIVVFPKPEKRIYPFMPGWKLSEIENHIRQYASPFAEVHAVNPVYEPLSVTFRAVLKKGTADPGTVKRRIARRIRVFLMAWYIDGRLPDFGVRYSCDALLARTVNDENIEEFISLEIRTGNRQYRITKELRDEDIFLSASDECGVLYIDTLCVELADSRRGVEEGKIGTDFMIG